MDKMAEVIMVLLARRGWSRNDFARRAGVPIGTVNAWFLRQGARMPTVEHARRAAGALGVSLDYLCTGIEHVASTTLSRRIAALTEHELRDLDLALKIIEGRRWVDGEPSASASAG